MKLSTVVACCVVAGVVAPKAVQAQVSEDAFAAWAAMMFTPVGAFPAIMVKPGTAGTQRTIAWAVRGSTWEFEPAANRNYNAGVSLFAPVGTTAIFSATVGLFAAGADGADNLFMLGGDLEAPFWESVKTANQPVSFSLSAKGSAGFGRFFGDDPVSHVSLVGSIPAGLRYEMADRSSLSAMVAPGFGFGSLSGGGPGASSASGTRGMISIGGAWTTAGGVGFHLDTQKVFVDGGPPWVWGLSVSFVPGR